MLFQTGKGLGDDKTPEAYAVYAYAKAGAILLGVIPCLFVFPLLSPVVVFLTIAAYFKETKKLDEQLKAKREHTESDLPRFVATIEQELKNSLDVLSTVQPTKQAQGNMSPALCMLLPVIFHFY